MFLLNLHTQENPRLGYDKGCTMEAIFGQTENKYYSTHKRKDVNLEIKKKKWGVGG